jgi:hypothetical protein
MTAIKAAPVPCTHTLRAPVRGMKVVDRGEAQVTFACTGCGATYEAVRCTVATKIGTRCAAAAVPGEASCALHRPRTALGIA